jgi:hypothetical protein
MGDLGDGSLVLIRDGDQWPFATCYFNPGNKEINIYLAINDINKGIAIADEKFMFKVFNFTDMYRDVMRLFEYHFGE